MAVKEGHLDIVEQLVKSKADINVKDVKGVSTCMTMFTNESFELKPALLSSLNICPLTSLTSCLRMLNHYQNKYFFLVPTRQAHFCSIFSISGLPFTLKLKKLTWQLVSKGSGSEIAGQRRIPYLQKS